MDKLSVVVPSIAVLHMRCSSPNCKMTKTVMLKRFKKMFQFQWNGSVALLNNLNEQYVPSFSVKKNSLPPLYRENNEFNPKVRKPTVASIIESDVKPPVLFPKSQQKLFFLLAFIVFILFHYDSIHLLNGSKNNSTQTLVIRFYLILESFLKGLGVDFLQIFLFLFFLYC